MARLHQGLRRRDAHGVPHPPLAAPHYFGQDAARAETGGRTTTRTLNQYCDKAVSAIAAVKFVLGSLKRPVLQEGLRLAFDQLGLTG